MKLKRKLLVILENLPSEKKSNVWGHALSQICSLSEECDITIASPELLSLSLWSYKRNKKQISKLPTYKYRVGNIQYWRPRYLDFSIFSWNYRKNYFQIVSMIFSLLLLIIRKGINIDIIHAHYVYRTGYVAAIIGKILRKPVIITAHGSDIHQNLYSENILFRKRTVNALRWSSKVIAVSESLKKIIDKEVLEEKTFVLPCGLDNRLFYPMNTIECRRVLSLLINKKILLFVGTLNPVKGVDILINAFKRIRDKDDNVELIIIGDGPLRSELEQKVRNFGIAENVHFLGRKNHNKIHLYINASDIIVQPSRNEGRGLAIMEALACGKPIVASRVGGIPETIINNKLGILVEKENPVALADGIINALNGTWDKRYISKYAKQFSQSHLAPQLLKIYDEVLSEVT